MSGILPGLWVHRLSIGDSGMPEAAVELEDVQNDLGEVARAVMVGPRHDLQDQPEQATAFLVSELFERGSLRQGWGAPGMRADRATQFMKNYVIAMWRYWNAIPLSVREELRRDQDYSRVFQILEPYYSQAAGRLKILTRMIAMRRGDVVFIPNVPSPGASFSVARIEDVQYTFEDRAKSEPAAYWEVDFGHRRRVRDVRKFEYGGKTLTPSVFASPYRHAIDKVSARESQFRAFIDQHYQE